MSRTRATFTTARTLVAAIITTLLPVLAVAQPTDEVRYYHSDAVGTVRLVTDTNGQVKARYDYLPFGERWTSPDPADSRMYAGKERDADTGLDYFGARYYAAVTGRFTSVDPDLGIATALTDPQRWNRYAYVGNRPTRVTDPNGRGWASALFKVAKAVYKGGSVATEFASVVEDARTLVSSEATTSERVWAAASLASEVWSPVGIRDVGAAASLGTHHMRNAAAEVTASAAIGPVGDAGALGLSRIDRFKNLTSGFSVGDTHFSLNPHVVNSLRKSGRREIDPETMIRALAGSSLPGTGNSRVFTDPATGTRFFVNAANEVVGVHPKGFR